MRTSATHPGLMVAASVAVGENQIQATNEVARITTRLDRGCQTETMCRATATGSRGRRAMGAVRSGSVGVKAHLAGATVRAMTAATSGFGTRVRTSGLPGLG